jgi:hypothetical protein
MKINSETIWYVVASKKSPEQEENYPLSIYADKELAQAVADANNEKVIPVQPMWGPA